MNTTKTAPRAAVYLRQSQDRNGDELAITRQRADCLALCATKGWEPIEYVDNDCSASTGKPRKDYQRMLADIRAGVIEAVVVWDLDRLHRRPIELESFIDLADAKRLALATVTGECDLSTHNGRLYARIKGAVARAEMDQKSARQKRAARQRAEAGTQWWSVRPFGFAYHDGRPVLDDDGRPTLDRAEAAVIRAAYTAVQAGSSVYAITADLNTRGVATAKGNKWRPSQTRQLLLSPRNAGLRTLATEVIDDNGRVTVTDEVIGRGEWPAIVAEDLWRAVQHKLTDPAAAAGSPAPASTCSPTSRPAGCAGPAWVPVSPSGPAKPPSTPASPATRCPAMPPTSTLQSSRRWWPGCPATTPPT